MSIASVHFPRWADYAPMEGAARTMDEATWATAMGAFLNTANSEDRARIAAYLEQLSPARILAISDYLAWLEHSAEHCRICHSQDLGPTVAKLRQEVKDLRQKLGEAP